MPIVVLAGLLMVAGCGRREAAKTTDDALQQRMQNLQTELGSIQDELRAQLASMQAGHGRGAYAGGPRSIAGTETVLERLHRTELALRQAQNGLDDKTRAIVNLRREQASNVETITDLSAKAERLQRAEDRRITALQERQHALQEQEELRQHLVAAELARLESEKRLYELITEVIQLEPSQT
ncbi:MAG: hypothetical protein ACOCXA_06750, partial [Planctomycetota bacterium]